VFTGFSLSPVSGALTCSFQLSLASGPMIVKNRRNLVRRGWSEAGMQTEVSAVHRLNATVLACVSFESNANAMVVSDVQPAKQCWQSVSTDDGMANVESDVQQANTSLSMHES
jgi:hypothetical protein